MVKKTNEKEKERYNKTYTIVCAIPPNDPEINNNRRGHSWLVGWLGGWWRDR